MTPEGKIVAAIKSVVKELHGEVRKCQWVGRIGAPDLLIMLPGWHFWVEVKAPGKKPKAHQQREHKLMAESGCEVRVYDAASAVAKLIADRYSSSDGRTERQICLRAYELWTFWRRKEAGYERA
jgi:hypothetical protein